MQVTVLAGGVGSARLGAGLVRVLDPSALTFVVNTGDDEQVCGLHVSPDVDTVLYHLAGLCDWERGWGVAGDTFTAHDRYAALAARAPLPPGVDLQAWFALGDRDLATNLLRTRLLACGLPLSAATDVLRRALGVGCRVLPVSDDPVRTVVRTVAGDELAFQDYFVRRGQADEVAEVRFAGAGRARPAPGVLEAIGEAEVLLIPPSNPLLSIAPLLAVPGVREAVAGAGGRRVAVSPIVGGRALKGPADRLLRSLGHEVSAVGVARILQGLADEFVLDRRDETLAPRVAELGMRPVVCDTVMRSPEDAARLAKEVLGA